MHLPPARPIGFATTTTDLQLVTGTMLLWGWSFTETTGGATAEVQLFDGTGTGGQLITDITLLPSESTRDDISEPGIAVSNSLYLDVVSGSVKGSVWVVPGERVNEYFLAQGLQPIWSLRE